jgi:hypothetical protein
MMVKSNHLRKQPQHVKTKSEIDVEIKLGFFIALINMIVIIVDLFLIYPGNSSQTAGLDCGLVLYFSFCLQTWIYFYFSIGIIGIFIFYSLRKRNIQKYLFVCLSIDFAIALFNLIYMHIWWISPRVGPWAGEILLTIVIVMYCLFLLGLNVLNFADNKVKNTRTE